MYSLEIINRINAEAQPLQTAYELRLHPRIVELTRTVNELPVGQEYRRWLRRSLCKYADQIIARPEATSSEEMDDLEDLQQVSLSDWNEAALNARLY